MSSCTMGSNADDLTGRGGKNQSIGLTRHVRRACRVFFLFLLTGILSASIYEPTLSVVLLGDILLGRGVAQAHASGGWENTLGSLAPILHSADIAAANLESPLSCENDLPRENERRLVAPADSAVALEAAGLDIVSLVNNHALDAGDAGISCTQTRLSPHSIHVLTAEQNQWKVSTPGLSVVFVAWNMVGNSANPELLLAQVRRLAEEKLPVIVSIHWGMEHQLGADQLQRTLAQALVQSGATVVWGHHPHAIQETEPAASALVLYSLGNCVFDQYAPASTRQGMLAWLAFDRRGLRQAFTIRFPIHPRAGRTETPDLFTLRRYPLPADD